MINYLIPAILAATTPVTPFDVEVPNAMAGPWQEYFICLQANTLGPSRVVPRERRAFDEKVKVAIESCADVRAESKRDAEKLMQSDPAFADANVRAARIEHALANAELAQRNLFDINSPPESASQPTRAVPVVSKEARVSLGSIQIPDEISPAVVPYMLCMQSASGIPVYGMNDQLLNDPENKTDCQPVREKAVADGVRMLRNQRLGRNKREREAYVEKVLLNIDEFTRTKTQEELLEMLNED